MSLKALQNGTLLHTVLGKAAFGKGDGGFWNVGICYLAKGCHRQQFGKSMTMVIFESVGLENSVNTFETHNWLPQSLKHENSPSSPNIHWSQSYPYDLGASDPWACHSGRSLGPYIDSLGYDRRTCGPRCGQKRRGGRSRPCEWMSYRRQCMLSAAKHLLILWEFQARPQWSSCGSGHCFLLPRIMALNHGRCWYFCPVEPVHPSLACEFPHNGPGA